MNHAESSQLDCGIVFAIPLPDFLISPLPQPYYIFCVKFIIVILVMAWPQMDIVFLCHHCCIFQSPALGGIDKFHCNCCLFICQQGMWIQRILLLCCCCHHHCWHGQLLAVILRLIVFILIPPCYCN